MQQVCKYPKQPTGPSGFGASGVRRIQGGGGPYQRTRPNGTTLSIKSGEFSRVIIEDTPEYLASGYDGDYLKKRDTLKYAQSFRPSRVKDGDFRISVTGGYYAQALTKYFENPVTEESYSYEVRPGVFESVTFQRRIFDQAIEFVGYYRGSEITASYDCFYSYQKFPPGNTGYLKSQDEIQFWGIRKANGRNIVAIGTTFFNRYDPVGRPLHDAFFYRSGSKGGIDSYPITPSGFTREDAEFCWITPTVVLRGYTVGVLAEMFFRPGLVNPFVDYRPKFWIVATPNDGDFGSLVTFTDVTTAIFSGARVPDAMGLPGWYGGTSGRQYGADLSVTMSLMKGSLVAVGDNEFVMAWPHRMPDGWRQRVARVKIVGGAANASLTYESADNPLRSSAPLWQHVVHLGDGVVIAKVLSGWIGIGNSVTIRKSTDRGLTWGADISPAGFDAPLLNQFFGDFTVHSAKDATKKKAGVVLITAWSVTASAYYVYASSDAGSNWTRKGEIYKPTAFARVDSLEAVDGGGNFESILPGPSPTRLADVTLPNRYKDRP